MSLGNSGLNSTKKVVNIYFMTVFFSFEFANNVDSLWTIVKAVKHLKKFYFYKSIVVYRLLSGMSFLKSFKFYYVYFSLIPGVQFSFNSWTYILKG